MKKILLALCAVSLLTMVACKKDNGENKPHGGNTPAEQQEPEGDGYYLPTVKIAFIGNNGNPYERWDWNDGLLESIDTADASGGYSPASLYTYANKRLTQTYAELFGSMVDINYSYNGKLLKSVAASAQGMTVLTANFVRTANDKIGTVNLDLNDELLQMILPMLLEQLGGFGGNGDSSKYCPDQTANYLVSMLQHPKGSKFSYDNSSFALNFEWTGDNATRVLLTGSVDLTVTVEELRNLLSLDSNMATYAAMLGMLGNDTELPVSLSINDTITHTYDNHPNPYLGFLGRPDISAFSANNVENTIHHGSVAADITISTFLGDQHIPFSKPLPSTQMSNSYTYNANGYPSTITDQDGNTFEITYLQ